jgi:hypothetical protein
LQTKGTSAKALRQEQAWHIRERKKVSVARERGGR